MKIEDSNIVPGTNMPQDIVELILRVPDDKFENYESVKDMLFKRLTLSTERFSQKFV